MSLEVRRASVEDAPGIRALFERVFGRALSPEEWLWKYPRNPDGWASVVSVSGGTIVGHYGGWPMRFLVDGRERRVYALGDVMTDPAARALGGRRNAFSEMGRAMFEILREESAPFGFGFPSPRALAVGERLLGYRSRFAVEELSLPAREEGSEHEISDVAGEEVDELWRAREAGFSGAVRDRERANWRFHARPSRYYRMVLAREGGRPAAWAALSISGPAALVADYLVAAPAGAGRLVSAVVSEAFRAGAERAVFWLPPSGPERERLLGEAGRRGGGRAPAGFTFTTAVTFEEETLGAALSRLHFVPALYDDR